MKKLLLLGAILALGATAFGQKYTLSGNGTSGYNGTSNLKIISEGHILEAPTDPMLEVVVSTALGGGNDIRFDFGNLYVGDTATQRGEFTARIVKNTETEAGNPPKFEALPVEDDVFNADLSVPANAVDDPTGFKSYKLYDVKNVSAVVTDDDVIGTIGYNLTFKRASASDFIGDIVAKVDAQKVGYFLDTKSSIDVTVTNYK